MRYPKWPREELCRGCPAKDDRCLQKRRMDWACQDLSHPEVRKIRALTRRQAQMALINIFADNWKGRRLYYTDVVRLINDARLNMGVGLKRR